MRKLLILFLVLVLNSSPLHGEEQLFTPLLFQVIVNAQNPITSLERKYLADIFFKKVTHWPENGFVRPVDQGPSSLARQKFSEEILKRSVLSVKNYWQQLIFSGRDVPPPELTNDEEVIGYVVKNPNSIGYVSGAFLSEGREPIGYKTINIK